MAEFYCGYCLGDVIFSDENVQWEHATDGQRVQADSPGDYVSAQHNRKGSRVLAADVCSRSDEPALPIVNEYTADLMHAFQITDSGGYLSCGCHGSQSEHICRLAIEADRESAMRAEGGYDS